MPTVLRIRSFRFHFYSDEGNEPAHVHIDCADGECKFWLNPIKLASNYNVPAIKIREIEKLVFENRELLIYKYAEFHNK
jgi:hypothetical protein